MGRLALLGDVHGNREALDSVVADLAGVDRVCCLGDVVGYGPDPEYCVEVVASLGATCVLGNHDEGVISADPPNSRDFTADALRALLWTRDRLGADHVAWLRQQPLHSTVDGLRLVHGCPPADNHRYLEHDDVGQIAAAMGRIGASSCAVGHTHVPGLAVFESEPRHTFGGRWRSVPVPPSRCPLRLQRGQRFLLNPGSVGQPRNHCAAAGYAVFDTRRCEISFHRVRYDFRPTQRKILAAKLPRALAVRLATGSDARWEREAEEQLREDA